jgi:hypothetical protein
MKKKSSNEQPKTQGPRRYAGSLAEQDQQRERGEHDSQRGRRKATRPGMPTSARTRSLIPPDPKDDQDRIEMHQEAAAAEAIQAPLIPDSEIPAIEAKAIQNNRMAATYVGLSLSRDKEQEKRCSLEFSMTLTDEHREYVPDKVARAQAWLVAQDNKLIQVNHVAAQTVDIFDEPKAKKPTLHIVGAEVEKASVAMIEETGKGKAKKVIRFVFRLRVERDKDVIDFGAWNDECQFWLSMAETQLSLET